MKATNSTTGKTVTISVRGVAGAERYTVETHEGLDVEVRYSAGSLRGDRVLVCLSSQEDAQIRALAAALPLRQAAPRARYGKR